MDIYTIIMAVVPSLLTGTVLFYFQRRQKRRDAQTDDRAAKRRVESLLSLDVQIATLKLSEATAIAVQHGEINGEMTEAREACTKAKEAYYRFLNTQAVENLQKGGAA